MIELLRFTFTLFIIYQITSIVAESGFPLFKWLRNQNGTTGELLGCFLCVSVWIGWLVSLFLFDISFELGYCQLSWFWSGLLYSSLTWFIHLIEGKLS